MKKLLERIGLVTLAIIGIGLALFVFWFLLAGIGAFGNYWNWTLA